MRIIVELDGVLENSRVKQSYSYNPPMDFIQHLTIRDETGAVLLCIPFVPDEDIEYGDNDE